MDVVLAIEPDRAQSDVLRQVLRGRRDTELVLVTSKDDAIAAINLRVPDLILVSALLSPRDEGELVAHLRSIDNAAHLQTLTIPQLRRAEKRAQSKSLFGFNKKKQPAAAAGGCDPAVFAEEVAGYLARAREVRSEPRAAASRMGPTAAHVAPPEAPAATSFAAPPVEDLWPARAAAPLSESAAEPVREFPSLEPALPQPSRVEPTPQSIDQSSGSELERLIAKFGVNPNSIRMDESSTPNPQLHNSQTLETPTSSRDHSQNVEFGAGAVGVESTTTPTSQLPNSQTWDVGVGALGVRESPQAVADILAADVALVQAEVEARLAAEIERVQNEAAERRMAELAKLQAEAEALREAAIGEARAAAETEARDALAAELARVREEAEHTLTDRLSRVRTEAEQTVAAEVGRAREHAEQVRLADLARVEAEANERADAAAKQARLVAETEASQVLAQELARVRSEAELTFAGELERARAEANRAREAEQARLKAEAGAEQARLKAEADALRSAVAEEARTAAEAFAARALEFEVARVRAEAEARLEAEVERVRKEAVNARLVEQSGAQLEAERIRETAAREARAIAETAATRTLEAEIKRVRTEAEARLAAEMANLRADAERRRATDLEEMRAQIVAMRDAAAQQARSAAAEAAAEVARATTGSQATVVSTSGPRTVVRLSSATSEQTPAPLTAADTVEAPSPDSSTPTSGATNYYSLWNAEAEQPAISRAKSYVTRHGKWIRSNRRTLSIAATLLLVVSAGLSLDTKSWFVALAKQLTPAEAAVAPPAAAPAARPAAPAKPVGQLLVESTPPGARVFLDGRLRGESPLTLEDVPVGKHRLVLESRSGTITRVVEIRPGGRTIANDVIMTGWLAVFCRIPLEVYVAGRRLGTTDGEQFMLAPGRHQVTFVSEHFNFRETKTINVEPGIVTSHSVALPTGTVRVTAPEGTEVWVEGERVGQAPLGELPVPIGTREIVARHADFGERRQTVEVRYGQTAEVTLGSSKQ